MHIYHITNDHLSYRHTLAAVHAVAKLYPNPQDVEIWLADYPINAATVEGLFNGSRPEGRAIKRWRLTKRGGLREVPLDPAQEHQAFAERALDYEGPPPSTEPPQDAATFWSNITKGKT